MKYTIKDNNGNFICSVEDVDPIRSNEGFLNAIGKGLFSLGKGVITFIGILAAIVSIICIVGDISAKKIKKNIKSILKVIGRENLKEIFKYAKNIEDKIYNELDKQIKSIPKFKSLNSISFYSSNGVTNRRINADNLSEYDIYNFSDKYQEITSTLIDKEMNNSSKQEFTLNCSCIINLNEDYIDHQEELEKYFNSIINKIKNIKTIPGIPNKIKKCKVYTTEEDAFADIEIANQYEETDYKNTYRRVSTDSYNTYIEFAFTITHDPKFINKLSDLVKNRLSEEKLIDLDQTESLK